MSHMKLSKKMESCIEACLSCHRTCLETISHCLGEGGGHAEKQHIVNLQICAAVCELSAKAMLLESHSHAAICQACAKVCEQCAASCESLEGDFMEDCAEVCRNCAEACTEMAKGSSKRTSKEHSVRI